MRPAQPHVETLRGSTISTGGEGQQRRGTFFYSLFLPPHASSPSPLSFPLPPPPPFFLHLDFLPDSAIFLLPTRFFFLSSAVLLLSVPHPCRSPNSTQEGSNHWPASLRMYVLTTELGHPAAAALYGKDAHAFSKACAKPIPP